MFGGIGMGLGDGLRMLARTPGDVLAHPRRIGRDEALQLAPPCVARASAAACSRTTASSSTTPGSSSPSPAPPPRTARRCSTRVRVSNADADGATLDDTVRRRFAARARPGRRERRRGLGGRTRPRHPHAPEPGHPPRARRRGPRHPRRRPHRADPGFDQPLRLRAAAAARPGRRRSHRRGRPRAGARRAATPRLRDRLPAATPSRRPLERPLDRDDVLGAFAGLRPLIDTGGDGSTADISRRHQSPSTGRPPQRARRQAHDVSGDGPRRGRPRVPARRRSPTPAAAPRRSPWWERPARRFRWRPATSTSGATADPELPASLVARFGAEASAVLDLARCADPAERIAPGIDVTRAEIEFAVLAEGALDVDDVLDRRTRIGLVAADRERAHTAVAEIVEEALAPAVEMTRRAAARPHLPTSRVVSTPMRAGRAERAARSGRPFLSTTAGRTPAPRRVAAGRTRCAPPPRSDGRAR